MGKVTDLAEKVLNENDLPMTAKQIYDYAVNNYDELVKETFSGKTPKDTLASQLYTNSKKQNTKFNKFKNGKDAIKFGLKSKDYGIESSNDSDNSYDDESGNDNSTEDGNANWVESDLHKYLASYMSDVCYCKTIQETESVKGKKNSHTWVHPDIVGVRFFKEYYDEITMKLLNVNNKEKFELYSFEIKRSIDLANANVEFFQAASNSSWANYGYLVAKDIDEEDDDLKEKLTRLNRTFGIGVIKLNVQSYSESKVLYEAQKNEIDYETIDKLIELNNDRINVFFKEILAICEDGRTEVLSSIFDDVFESDVEGETYAKSKNMIELEQN